MSYPSSWRQIPHTKSGNKHTDTSECLESICNTFHTFHLEKNTLLAAHKAFNGTPSLQIINSAALIAWLAIVSYNDTSARTTQVHQVLCRSTTERAKRIKTPSKYLYIFCSLWSTGKSSCWKDQWSWTRANLCHSSGLVYIHNRKTGREVSSTSVPSAEQQLQKDLIPTTPSASGKPLPSWHLNMIKLNCSKQSHWNLRAELGLFGRFLNAILWDMNLPF